MKNIFKLFILLIAPFLLISCEDEDDNYDINYTLILGKWIPYEAQERRTNVYDWDYSCGDEYLMITDNTAGEYSLHFENCSIYNNNPFTYRMENGYLYILEAGSTQEYRRQILTLTATELVLTDPDDWRENYIKFRK
nr:lipocalin family protein [uncultured Flavobacterium sp.]